MDMAEITLDRIAHTYSAPSAKPEDYALKPLDLVWNNGGAYALLGPSGCGKTTLLKIISGLLMPTHGRVLFDGQDVTHVPTEARNIAQVFQFPVVYDTMTVRENLAFPLLNRGMDAATARQRVEEVARSLDLTGDLDRRARRLTADAKQKVSLGRGLVRSSVNAILFDEPLTVIDPQLKFRLRMQLKRLHRESDFTMIYVTHDQTEALTFADQVVVMLDGEVVQVGTPEDLHQCPAHTFVGHFIGSPGMNILPVELQGTSARIAGYTIDLARSYPEMPDGVRVELGIRPENITLTQDVTGLPVGLRRVDDIGRMRILHVDLDGTLVRLSLDEDTPIPADGLRIRFEPLRTHIYADGHRVPGLEI
jgi:glycerol transport system ATP-binding protein